MAQGLRDQVAQPRVACGGRLTYTVACGVQADPTAAARPAPSPESRASSTARVSVNSPASRYRSWSRPAILRRAASLALGTTWASRMRGVVTVARKGEGVRRIRRDAVMGNSEPHKAQGPGCCKRQTTAAAKTRLDGDGDGQCQYRDGIPTCPSEDMTLVSRECV
jgi:hypothetical protein